MYFIEWNNWFGSEVMRCYISHWHDLYCVHYRSNIVFLRHVLFYTFATYLLLRTFLLIDLIKQLYTVYRLDSFEYTVCHAWHSYKSLDRTTLLIRIWRLFLDYVTSFGFIVFCVLHKTTSSTTYCMFNCLISYTEPYIKVSGASNTYQF